MAYRETLQIGDPLLKASNTKVINFDDSKIKRVIQDLIDTMRKNDLAGLAAPQIGENYKIFVTEPRVTQFRTIDQADKLRFYINPTITNYSTEKCVTYEGCGSVLNAMLFGPVKRPKQITIEAYNETGKKFQLRCDGLLSRVIQHEYDHLYGIEFTEKIFDYGKLLAREFYIQNIKNSPAQLTNTKIHTKEFKWL